MYSLYIHTVLYWQSLDTKNKKKSLKNMEFSIFQWIAKSHILPHGTNIRNCTSYQQFQWSSQQWSICLCKVMLFLMHPICRQISTVAVLSIYLLWTPAGIVIASDSFIQDEFFVNCLHTDLLSIVACLI